MKYIGELSPRTKDVLVSFGERLSVRIVSSTLNKLGVPSQSFDSWVLGMATSSEFGNAEVDENYSMPLMQISDWLIVYFLKQVLEETYSNIKTTLSKIDSMIVPVVTGFIGRDAKGRITTLGRGGSDLTATVIGAAAGVDEVQVWKDVDGIMTSDPR